MFLSKVLFPLFLNLPLQKRIPCSAEGQMKVPQRWPLEGKKTQSAGRNQLRGTRVLHKFTTPGNGELALSSRNTSKRGGPRHSVPPELKGRKFIQCNWVVRPLKNEAVAFAWRSHSVPFCFLYYRWEREFVIQGCQPPLFTSRLGVKLIVYLQPEWYY